MLRSEICCPRSNVGGRCRGSGLPAQHSLGGLKALEEREQRGSWCQRPGLAIRRPNAIEHASLEFRAGLDLHVRSRVERLVVEPQRDSRDGKPAENMLRSRLSDRNRRLPRRARSARKQSDVLRAPEPMRNIGRHMLRATYGDEGVVRRAGAGRAHDSRRSPVRGVSPKHHRLAAAAT